MVAQTYYLPDDEMLERLADLPGDRLLVEPDVAGARSAGPADSSSTGPAQFGDATPDCDMREANRAGAVEFGLSDAYKAVGRRYPSRVVTAGALVRYSDDGREVTVVGTSEFMTNAGLLEEGNAALAMNLAGAQPRMIWYAPQHSEGESTTATQRYSTSFRTT